MSTHRIPPLCAFVSESSRIPGGVLASIAAACQKQVIRDFAPAWGVSATVAAFPDEASVPMGYWKLIIKDTLDDPNALGYHTDEHGQPYALVEAQDPESTCTTCSHELLEALADPWGSRLVVCSIPQQKDYVRARALVEVCDPCEAFTYEIDGLPVSDFVTPRYYGPHHWGAAHPAYYGEKLSFLGAISHPLTVEQGGYLSYVDGNGAWWQTTWFGGSSPSIRNISGRLAELPPQGSLRAAIDRVTAEEAQGHIGAA